MNTLDWLLEVDLIYKKDCNIAYFWRESTGHYVTGFILIL